MSNPYVRPRQGPFQRRNGARAATRQMTPREQDEVHAVIDKISAALDGVEVHTMVEALAFFLIAAVKDTYELPSHRDAVDYVAESIRRFGQIAMS